MKKIAEGRTAEVFLVEKDKVLKLFISGYPYDSVKREYETSRILHEKGLPVPQAFEITEMNDRHGIVFEYVSGPSMLDMISGKPWRSSHLAREMAVLQYDVCKAYCESLPSFKSILAENISKVGIFCDSEKTELLKTVSEIPDSHHLCHGDFHPGNIIYSRDKFYIIDWMNACKGIPELDAARTGLLLRTGGVPSDCGILKKLLIRLIRNNFYRRYIKEFTRISGIDYATVEKYTIPMAAARMNENSPESENAVLFGIVNSRKFTGKRVHFRFPLAGFLRKK